MRILVVVLCVALCGCNPRVAKVQFTEAEKLCELNGGLDYLVSEGLDFGTFKVVCNNSAEFYLEKFYNKGK